jgi:hypothetical protein
MQSFMLSHSLRYSGKSLIVSLSKNRFLHLVLGEIWTTELSKSYSRQPTSVWSMLHPLSYIVPYLSYAAPHLSYVALHPNWVPQHPTEARCTLNKLRSTLSELRCTLSEDPTPHLSYAAPHVSYAAPKMSYAVPLKRRQMLRGLNVSGRIVQVNY